ncbi:MAG TPA: hypothetical protein VMD79_13905 [Solirubrobacteraceae bacterium]|nr:hypothetical protein [Solirubrobacteraceae bacterium]
MRLGDPVFRPFVYVSLACGAQSTTLLEGLIDTGADAVLASDLLAERLEVDLTTRRTPASTPRNRLVSASIRSGGLLARGPESP